MAQDTLSFVVPNGEFQGESTITRVNFGEECVGVGVQSFESCSELSEINDGNVIETIGSCAFAHTGLKSATFNSVKTIFNKAFDGCKELTSISISNDCTSIGDCAFGDCEKLTSVEIPNNPNFTTINDETFYKCASLSKIIIPNNVTTIGDRAFKECEKLTDVTIGSGVETIGNDAFNFCTTLSTISIPDSVKTIGSGAFKQCGNLTDVTIGSNVETIGNDAFNLCSTLPTVSIPDSVKTIGSGAFKQCYSIKSVKIGKNVTSIGDGAFSECSSFTDVELNCETVGSWFRQNGTIENVCIGDNVKTIGGGAFSGCDKIERVYTNNLTKWCNIKFENSEANPVTNSKTLYCNGNKIINLEIPDGVTSIGSYNFYNCKDIISIRIPSTMTSNIGGDAFFGSGEVNTKDGVPNFNNYNGCRGHVIINYSENLPDLKCGNENYGCIALYAADIINAVYDIGLYIFDAKKNGNLTHYVGTYFGSENSDSDSDYKNTEIVFPTNNDQQNYKVLSTLFNRRPNVNGMGSDRYTDDITSVTILENSAEEFENNVFDGCINLSELIINYSDTPLKLGYKYHNTKVDENGKPQTGEGLFYDCQNIKNITLNRNLDYDAYAKKEYGYSPFSGIKSKFDVEIGDNVTKIGNLLFYNSGINNITIGENVEEIGGSAFEVCHKLNGNIVIPNSVEKIGACAFYNCANLTNVTLPKNDKFNTISERLFYHCYNLKDVTIPDSVTTIENYAFENCKTIKNVYIPDSVTKIGENAFYNCSGIKYITIGQGIGENSFGENSNSFRSAIEDSNGNIIKDIIKKHEVINFSQIELPDEKGIVVIDGEEEEVYISTKYGYVVYGASYLLNAINGSREGDFIFGKKSESDEKFSLLRYLRDNDEVLDDIPEKYSPEKNVEHVYRIDDGVFAGHTEIKEITIPGGVYEIGNDVFNGCKNLKEMSIVYCDDNTELVLGLINNNDDEKTNGLLYETNIETFYLDRNIDYNTKESYSPLCNKTTLKTVEIGDNVTKINKYLFRGTGLENVKIPNNVTSIGVGAFYHCEYLKSVKISNAITIINDSTFDGCTSLTSVIIPNKVTRIGNGAFNNCEVLTSIVIPNSVTSIGDGAFIYCYKLENVYITNLYNWCNIEFENEASTPMCYTGNEPKLYLKNTLVDDNEIQEDTIDTNNYTLVKDIKIPDGIEVVKNFTFYGCCSLEKVEIHSGVKSIGISAFENCKYITDVIIHGQDGFVINNNSFDYCENLTNILLFNVTTICYDAFIRSRNIKNVFIKDILNWCKIEFQNNSSAPMWGGINEDEQGTYTSLYLKNTLVDDNEIQEDIIDTKNYTLVKELEIPDGIEVINNYTFYGCHSLEKVTIHRKVTKISAESFNGCYNLKTVINYSPSFYIIKGDTDNGYVGCYANRIVNAPNGKIFGDFLFGTKEVNGKKCDYLCGYIGNDTKIELPEKSPEEFPFGGGEYAIVEDVFLDYNDIVSVKIPNTVVGIGNSAFYGCTRLTNITIPESVQYIGIIDESNANTSSNTFYGCSCLTSVTIGNGCTYIGKTTFGDCCNLKRLVLGKNVGTREEINPDIIDCDFELLIHFCPSYSNMPLPKEDTKNIDYSSKTVEEKDNWMCSFDYVTEKDGDYSNLVPIIKLCCYMGDNSELIIPKLEELSSIIPNDFKDFKYYVIGKYSFAYMNNITSITITEDVDVIEWCAFKDCIGLKRVVIENDKENIFNSYTNKYNYDIFEGCKNYICIDFSNTNNDNINYFSDCGCVEYIYESGGFIVDDFIFNSNENDDIYIKIYIGNDSELELPELPKLPEFEDGYIFDNNFHYIDGINYNKDGDNFYNDGDYKDYICTSIKISDSVTSISDGAFENFKNLTKIEIGKGVTSIGNDIFREIYKLNEILVDKKNEKYYSLGGNAIIEKETNTLIYGCNRTIIPDGVMAIGEYAFKYTPDLVSIKIPESVKFIATNAFEGCYFTKENFENSSELDEVENGYWGATIVDFETDDGLLIKGNTVISCRPCATEVTIETITFKEKDIYGNEYSVTKAVTSIGKFAFNVCDALTSVTIGNSVTSIGEAAFAYITSLKTVIIKERNGTENVLKIEKEAFYDCKGINNITIPNYVTYDDELYRAEKPFYGCIVTADNFSSPNKNNRRDDWGATIIEKSNSNKIEYVVETEDGLIITREKIDDNDIINVKVYFCRPWATEVTIPETVTFTKKDSSGNEQVLETRNVTIIGDGVFKDCSSLTSVTIGNHVTSIGVREFSGCYSLTSVVIPNSVTSIGEKAFYWCNNLTSITLINNSENGSIGISGEDSKTIGIGAFTHVSNNFKIYVPKELITNYINNAEWRYYSEYIEGYD